MVARPWWAGRGVLVSGVFLAVVIVVAGVFSVVGARSSSSSPSRARVDTGGSRCGLPAGSQDPVVGPPRASWVLVGGIAAPSVPGAGPGIVEADDRRCFAHSPLGALVAAANFLPVTGHARDPGLGMDHYAPGRLRDVYARQPAIPVDPGTSVQTVAFKVVPLGRDAVDVSLALRIDGVLAYVVLPMRWSSPGDWRVQLLSAGQPVDAGRLDSTVDYVPWSGA